jgi:hypothetical protein
MSFFAHFYNCSMVTEVIGVQTLPRHHHIKFGQPDVFAVRSTSEELEQRFNESVSIEKCFNLR